jgi:hypothetical protein
MPCAMCLFNKGANSIANPATRDGRILGKEAIPLAGKRLSFFMRHGPVTHGGYHCAGEGEDSIFAPAANVFVGGDRFVPRLP